MPFKYNPVTRTRCEVCERALKENVKPVIDSYSGKASSANNFPFHNWYNFVLGYTPKFPEYLLKKFSADKNSVVLDPFMGSGTTNVFCKKEGIKSYGIEANDYFIDVASAKLNWELDISVVQEKTEFIISEIENRLSTIDFEIGQLDSLFNLSSSQNNGVKKTSFRTLAAERPSELPEKYVCDRPFVKLLIIEKVIIETLKNYPIELIRFFKLAWSSIIVPSSNISYGPGFGVRKPKFDVDVLKLFKEKLSRMISDLKSVSKKENKKTKFKIIHDDSRNMDRNFEKDSIDFIVTSPPYPGDHEYTKHTKLELIFEDHARSLKEFREIKKRMLVGSTTNIYKGSNDRIHVDGNPLIQHVTNLIQKRLDEDNATSGFEKLYTKLVWEYFGGMALVFKNALKILRANGKFSLLVSDSHAFKMVHIQTAEILKNIALKEGFSEGEIECWQFKKSTSHKYNLREDILTLTK